MLVADAIDVAAKSNSIGLRAEVEPMKVAGQIGVRVAGKKGDFIPMGAEIKDRSE